MFWTDWGRVAKIQRAGMDGSSRMVLVDSKLRWPNGLAVDHLQRTIYWVDASTNSVEMVDFSGTNRKAIIGRLYYKNMRTPSHIYLYV